jgi:hypothetical protein
MNEDDNIIGWTIVSGNPVDGFTLYGNYPSNEAAGQAADNDPYMDADWWIAPIYAKG